MVRFLIEVLVLLGTDVYESTLGEYIRTQQALTIGCKYGVAITLRVGS
jgi:hypothetical protein